MLVEVRPIYRRGKDVSKSVREKDAPHRGKLSIAENRLHSAGRVVTCARLTNNTDPNEPDLLPELADAQVIWLMDDQLRVRGVEKVDGVLYAQTWDIKVLSC